MTQEPEQPKLPNPNGKDWVGLDFFQFRLGWVEFFLGLDCLDFWRTEIQFGSRVGGFLGFIHVVSDF